MNEEEYMVKLEPPSSEYFRGAAVKAVEELMSKLGIGESAVDLIPDAIRRPNPVPKEDALFWTHTCGKLKLGVLMVRQVIDWRQA